MTLDCKVSNQHTLGRLSIHRRRPESPTDEDPSDSINSEDDGCFSEDGDAGDEVRDHYYDHHQHCHHHLFDHLPESCDFGGGSGDSGASVGRKEHEIGSLAEAQKREFDVKAEENKFHEQHMTHMLQQRHNSVQFPLDYKDVIGSPVTPSSKDPAIIPSNSHYYHHHHHHQQHFHQHQHHFSAEDNLTKRRSSFISNIRKEDVVLPEIEKTRLHKANRRNSLASFLVGRTPVNSIDTDGDEKNIENPIGKVLKRFGSEMKGFFSRKRSSEKEKQKIEFGNRKHRKEEPCVVSEESGVPADHHTQKIADFEASNSSNTRRMHQKKGKNRSRVVDLYYEDEHNLIAKSKSLLDELEHGKYLGYAMYM